MAEIPATRSITIPTEVRGWNWRGGPLRPLLVAFLALVLVGMVLCGHRKRSR